MKSLRLSPESVDTIINVVLSDEKVMNYVTTLVNKRLSAEMRSDPDWCNTVIDMSIEQVLNDINVVELVKGMSRKTSKMNRSEDQRVLSTDSNLIKPPFSSSEPLAVTATAPRRLVKELNKKKSIAETSLVNTTNKMDRIKAANNVQQSSASVESDASTIPVTTKETSGVIISSGKGKQHTRRRVHDSDDPFADVPADSDSSISSTAFEEEEEDNNHMRASSIHANKTSSSSSGSRHGHRHNDDEFIDEQQPEHSFTMGQSMLADEEENEEERGEGWGGLVGTETAGSHSNSNSNSHSNSRNNSNSNKYNTHTAAEEAARATKNDTPEAAAAVQDDDFLSSWEKKVLRRMKADEGGSDTGTGSGAGAGAVDVWDQSGSDSEHEGEADAGAAADNKKETPLNANATSTGTAANAGADKTVSGAQDQDEGEEEEEHDDGNKNDDDASSSSSDSYGDASSSSSSSNKSYPSHLGGDDDKDEESEGEDSDNEDNDHADADGDADGDNSDMRKKVERLLNKKPRKAGETEDGNDDDNDGYADDEDHYEEDEEEPEEDYFTPSPVNGNGQLLFFDQSRFDADADYFGAEGANSGSTPVKGAKNSSAATTSSSGGRTSGLRKKGQKRRKKVSATGSPLRVVFAPTLISETRYRDRVGYHEKGELFFTHNEEYQFTLDQTREAERAEALGLTWMEWMDLRTDEDIAGEEREGEEADSLDDFKLYSGEYYEEDENFAFEEEGSGGGGGGDNSSSNGGGGGGGDASSGDSHDFKAASAHANMHTNAHAHDSDSDNSNSHSGIKRVNNSGIRNNNNNNNNNSKGGASKQGEVFNDELSVPSCSDDDDDNEFDNF